MSTRQFTFAAWKPHHMFKHASADLRRFPMQSHKLARLLRRRRHQAMKLLSEGFQGKAEEMFQDRGFSFAQAELNDTTTLAALRSKAERAQPKPTEKNPLYAKFLNKEQPAMTPEQLADIEARREAAQRHQEVCCSADC